MNCLLVAIWTLLFSLLQGPQQKVNTMEQQLNKLSSYEQRFEALKAISIDSIWRSVPAIEDTLVKIDVIHAYIDRLHQEIDASQGEEALNMAYQLSRQVSYERGIAKSLKSYGDIYASTGDYIKATAFFENSIQLAEKISYYEVLSANMVALAGIHKKQADYTKALNYYLQAVKMSEKTGNATLTGRRLYNLASFYHTAGNLDEALKYAHQSLQQSKDATVQTFNYHLISEILSKQQQYDQAVSYLHKSLKILPHNAGVLYHIGLIHKKQLQVDSALHYLNQSLQAIPEGASYKNLRLDAIAEIYEQQGDLSQALHYRLRSLEEVRKLKEKHTEAQCYNKLAQHFNLQKNPSQTIRYAKQALGLAKELKALAESRDAYQYMSEAYASTGQCQLAYECAGMYHQLKDSISNAGNMKKLVQMQMQYEFDQKEAVHQARLEQTKQTTEAARQQQQYLIYFLLVSSCLCAILAFVFYRYYALKHKDNKLLKQYNLEVHEQKEGITAQAEELKEVNEEIQKMNESLEFTVLQRTQQLEKQNQQLINYAFFNAHKLRGPLARILGLVYLLKLNSTIHSAEAQSIISKLEKSSEELDNVVKEINIILQTKNPVSDPTEK